MATLHFTIRKDSVPVNGMCPINLKYTHQRKWKDIPVGLKIHFKQWSDEACAPILACENREELLNKMAEYSSIAQKIIDDRIANGESLLPSDVKPLIVDALKPKKIIKPVKPTVELALEEYLNLRRHSLKPSTVQTYKTMMEKHLKPFCKDKNKQLNWSLFNQDFGEDWKDYFISHSKQNGTIAKNFRRLHTFLEWSFDRDYLITNYFRKWGKVKERPDDPVVCSEDDLNKIEKFASDKENSIELRRIADYFLFMCYTGLRVGDFLNLKYRNLSYEEAGKGYESEIYHIKLFSEKTEISLKIPLIDEAFNLILKYNNDLNNTLGMYVYDSGDDSKNKAILVYRINPIIEQFPDRNLFPKVFAKDINLHLKTIAKECGLNSSYERVERYGNKNKKVYKPKYALITCHTARRTFITLALQAGLNESTVMKYTGHKSYKTMARYVALSEEHLNKQIERIGSRGAIPAYTKLQDNFRNIFHS